MLLTIFGSILLVSVYSTLLYRWLQNLKKRVEGFYIGLYNGLDIPEDERHEYEISQPFLIFFWLTGLPLIGIPILCLEAGLILERRRAARQITFCVHDRRGLVRDPDTRKIFVTLPAPRSFRYSEEESHMLFPQTQPGWEPVEPGSFTSEERLSRVPRHAPAGVNVPMPTGSIPQQHHRGKTATPGLPYWTAGSSQEKVLQVLAQKHGIPFPPQASLDMRDLAKVWNAAGRPAA